MTRKEEELSSDEISDIYLTYRYECSSIPFMAEERRQDGPPIQDLLPGWIKGRPYQVVEAIDSVCLYPGLDPMLITREGLLELPEAFAASETMIEYMMKSAEPTNKFLSEFFTIPDPAKNVLMKYDIINRGVGTLATQIILGRIIDADGENYHHTPLKMYWATKELICMEKVDEIKPDESNLRTFVRAGIEINDKLRDRGLGCYVSGNDLLMRSVLSDGRVEVTVIDQCDPHILAAVQPK